ncbi:hypothetical protein H2O64_12540 [Kordia sp. YSTF-M3]|uniref:Uncharacterized protein n=1 Tax=Kordia aestuariivivens TaxID=2759037 RepID=A0ABR7QAD0_9FLAO|nr:DUF6090 family protein [Kordia aestuariivivens]MBC8755497.1 hypothetical protein [Kordia aestuariivivens]
MKNKKIGNYFAYAIGEIILVVIGILIAVSLNNWNQNRKEKQQLLNIYTIIADELNNDLKEIDKIQSFYTAAEPLYSKILNDSIKRMDYVMNPQLTYITIGFPEIVFDKRGYNQLTDFNTDNFQDSLPTQIIEFYTERLREIEIDDDLRAKDFQDNYSHYKKNYEWWADLISMKNNQKFIEYAITDPDYKNRVASAYFVTYKVFLPELEKFKKQAKVILEEIEKRE